MRRALIIVFWSTVSGAILYIAFSKQERIERLEARGAGQIETGGASRIWFTPAGELVAIRPNESELTVRVWSASPIGASPRERESTLAWGEKGASSRQRGEHIFAVA